MTRGGLSVLVVERELAVASAVATTLRRRGHAVTTVARADEALRLSVPDVVVAALELDGLDGLELLEALRRDGQGVRTVLMSVLPSLDDCRRAMRLGAAEFLAKPFDAGELILAVEGSSPPAPLPANPDPLCFRRLVGAEIEEAELGARELTAQLVRWGLGPTARARVVTAAVEVLDNAVRHAYPVEPGAIQIEAECDEREVVVRIRDQGLGFDAAGLNSGAPRDPARSGLARARALCEAMRIETAPGAGALLELRFAAYRTHFDEHGAIDLSELDWLTPGMSRKVLEVLRDEGAEGTFHLSPAMAVTVGRILTGAQPAPSAQEALWS